ncbi:hypothetical protein OIU84_024788 [Salix udensis]|uniref:Uncharacterized protein n=1 Tax=Salix udensis TaxID=889485 RepID=A0AAD6PCX5_9ROSI|nr:hypothetical protein OIU84_024788 [Salix udensis]
MIKFKQEYYASGNSYQLNELSSAFHQTRMLSIETRRTTSRQHLEPFLYTRICRWRKMIRQEPITTVEENLWG